MNIIKAEIEHAGEISRLNAAVQKMHAEHHPDVFKYPVDGTELEEFFRDQLSRDDTCMFLAIVDHLAVGYVWCEIQIREENAFKYGQKRIYIHQISVQPQFRNKEVGRKLMLEVENLAIRNGIDNIALDSWEFNKEAHSFFEQLGFSPFNVMFWKKI